MKFDLNDYGCRNNRPEIEHFLRRNGLRPGAVKSFEIDRKTRTLTVELDLVRPPSVGFINYRLSKGTVAS